MIEGPWAPGQNMPSGLQTAKLENQLLSDCTFKNSNRITGIRPWKDDSRKPQFLNVKFKEKVDGPNPVPGRVTLLLGPVLDP